MFAKTYITFEAKAYLFINLILLSLFKFYFVQSSVETNLHALEQILWGWRVGAAEIWVMKREDLYYVLVKIPAISNTEHCFLCYNVYGATQNLLVTSYVL